MRGPDESDKLDPEDRAQVEEVIKEIESHFDEGQEEFTYNWAAPLGDSDLLPERVWREVVNVAQRAGWSARIHDGTIIIKKRATASSPTD
jgi:hypothetical protein